MQIYTDKIRVLGSYIFDYAFKAPIERGYSLENRPNSRGQNESKYEPYRARAHIRDLIYSNIETTQTTKFLTLTYKDDIKDLDTSNYKMKLFVQRLNYYLRGGYAPKSPGASGHILRYLNVPELTKKGRVHNHMIIFNMPFIDQRTIQNDLWSNGHIWIEKTYNNPFHLSSYLSKYITKDRPKQFFNRKSYFPSRTLIQPQEEINPEYIINARQNLSLLTPEWSGLSQNEYNPVFKKIYNLKEYPQILDNLFRAC